MGKEIKETITDDERVKKNTIEREREKWEGERDVDREGRKIP